MPFAWLDLRYLLKEKLKNPEAEAAHTNDMIHLRPAGHAWTFERIFLITLLITLVLAPTKVRQPATRHLVPFPGVFPDGHPSRY